MKKIKLSKFALIIGILAMFFQANALALVGVVGALEATNQARKEASGKSTTDILDSQSRRASNEAAIEGTNSSKRSPHDSAEHED